MIGVTRGQPERSEGSPRPRRLARVRRESCVGGGLSMAE
jgi:hypothetical protein